MTDRAAQLQITSYKESHHQLSEAQHGYGRHHSCETALHVVTDNILGAMDRGEIALWAMVGLPKCFDMVPHDKLLEKLCLYGIDTFWIKDYLEGHTQQVQLTNSALGSVSRSSIKENSVGVYQGGSLSCVLWCIFANDLCLHVPDSVRIVQFADDTKIWTSGKRRDLPVLVSRIETALQCLFDWFCNHGTKVNAAKTEFIVFGSRQLLALTSDVSVKFNDSTIRAAKEVPNIGVIFYRNLSFQSHVSLIVQKCTGMLLALNNAKHGLPRNTIKHLIDALMTSAMRYCLSVVFGVCGQMEKRRLQKLLTSPREC